MTDVLKLLPPFEWRGKKYPVSARSVGFSHESVQHKFQYKDGEIVEQTGARNPTFSYTIPMREDIARGPYKSLFTEGLPVLFRDVRLRDAGPLVDPVYGHFTCVPTSFSDDADPNKRDGVDVKVEFMLSPEIGDADNLQPPTLQDIMSEAGALDAEVKKADWHQEPSPQGTTDILSAVNGVLFTGQRAIDRISGAMNDLAFRCEKIENTVDRLTDPKLWPFRRDARRLRDTAIHAAKYQDPTRTILTIAVGATKTLSTIAAEAGITVGELLAANPFLARSPMVPKGTKIRVPDNG